jgi:predicted nucleic acid-binding protein
MQQIHPVDFTKAQRLAFALSQSWYVIQPSERLRMSALQIVDRYDLCAADSLQLASALEWCEGDPVGRTFFTADLRLRDAALLAGFEAKSV